MTMTTAYEEFIDFIAGGTTPESVVAFRPSETARERVTELIRRQKTGGLTQEETAELNQCLQLENLIRLAKARARQRLSGA
jgi:hypothetical protein